MSLFDVDHRRAIIDRRAIADRLRNARRKGEAAATLRSALEFGRAEIARRLAEEPGRGRLAAQANAYLHDQIVRLAFEHATDGMTVSALREALNTSRKYAVPLAEYLDATGVTRRQGDLRFPREG
jgi:[protein-PII] uridylyltransferase